MGEMMNTSFLIKLSSRLSGKESQRNSVTILASESLKMDNSAPSYDTFWF